MNPATGDRKVGDNAIQSQPIFSVAGEASHFAENVIYTQVKADGWEQNLEGSTTHNVTVNKKLVIGLLVTFFISEALVYSVVYWNDSFSPVDIIVLADIIMSVSAVIFFGTLWKEVKPLLQWRSFSIKKALVYTAAALVFSYLVQLLTTWVNKSIVHTDEYAYFLFVEFKHPLLIMFFITAVSPAIFEELAYRGFVLGGLLKVISSRKAILISSFLFALVHFSLFSFFWLLPFALVLSYIRKKENTIWYGVLIHFVFNSLACLYEVYSLGIWSYNS